MECQDLMWANPVIGRVVGFVDWVAAAGLEARPARTVRLPAVIGPRRPQRRVPRLLLLDSGTRLVLLKRTSTSSPFGQMLFSPAPSVSL